MTDIILRNTAPGRWIIGRPYQRDGAIHVGGRTRWPSSPEDAVRIIRGMMKAQEADDATEGSETKRATHRQPDPDRLAPQARHVLNRLILMRGLTQGMAIQMSPPVYRLSGRIYEIREEFGHDAVETIYQTSGGSRYALYRWRGPDAVQLEMSEDAA